MTKLKLFLKNNRKVKIECTVAQTYKLFYNTVNEYFSKVGVDSKITAKYMRRFRGSEYRLRKNDWIYI